MSMDTIDDLHAAEDSLGTVTHHARAALDAPFWRRRKARRHLRAVLDAHENACRPTCGWAWDPEEADENCEFYADGTPACGCPCNHGRTT